MDKKPSSASSYTGPYGSHVTMGSFVKNNPRHGRMMSSSITKRIGGSPSGNAHQNASQNSKTPSTFVAPQVTVVDGKIMVDESSLLIARQETDYQNYTVIEETGRHVTSSSFMKAQPRDRWRDSETERFYILLSMLGTDFGVISKFLPGKNRQQVKNKFKKEEKSNPHRIAEALRHRRPLDMEILESESDRVKPEPSTLK